MEFISIRGLISFSPSVIILETYRKKSCFVERSMHKLDLILLFVIAALLAASFSADLVTTVQAAGLDPYPLAQGSEQAAAAPASPATGIAVALIGLLFGALTFLPLLVGKNGGREG
jgi:hypothetical protein